MKTNLILLFFLSMAAMSCTPEPTIVLTKSKASISTSEAAPVATATPTTTVVTTPKALCENGSTDELICNPLSGSNTTTMTTTTTTTTTNKSRLGLIAQLYEGQAQWTNIDKYILEGSKHKENIFFSNFDIPARSFSEGFGIGNNDFLKNQNGDKLVEWFAILAKGNIVLPEKEIGGFYHVVSISDDGIRVIVDGQTIINKPGQQAPTIDCATKLIELNPLVEKSFELTYFQGPREQIALSTYIKKIDNPAAFVKGTYCGTTKAASLLLADGYSIISPTWFTLPTGF